MPFDPADDARGGAALSGTTLAFVLLFSILSAIGVVIAIVIAVSTRRRGRVDTEKLAHREKTWLLVAAGSLAVVLFSTIFFTPYGESAGPDAQVVNVTGRQFAFTFQPNRVKVGQQVEFRVTSRDVTHGFAVFDPDGDFLFQTQVVPEHTQVRVWTFDTPGTYRVVCYEFCGVNHHNMVGQFEVTQ